MLEDQQSASVAAVAEAVAEAVVVAVGDATAAVVGQTVVGRTSVVIVV